MKAPFTSKIDPTLSVKRRSFDAPTLDRVRARRRLSTVRIHRRTAPADLVRLGVRSQRGIALVTILLISTTLSLMGLATQDYVLSNVRIAGAQRQLQITYPVANSMLNVFLDQGRPFFSSLVPNNFVPDPNIDITGSATLGRLATIQLQVNLAYGDLVPVEPYNFNPSILVPTPVRIQYLGRTGSVPYGSDPSSLYAESVDTPFCSDSFRVITSTATSVDSRGAADVNMFIISPC